MHNISSVVATLQENFLSPVVMVGALNFFLGAMSIETLQQSVVQPWEQGFTGPVERVM